MKYVNCAAAMLLFVFSSFVYAGEVERYKITKLQQTPIYGNTLSYFNGEKNFGQDKWLSTDSLGNTITFLQSRSREQSFGVNEYTINGRTYKEEDPKKKNLMLALDHMLEMVRTMEYLNRKCEVELFVLPHSGQIVNANLKCGG